MCHPRWFPNCLDSSKDDQDSPDYYTVKEKYTSLEKCVFILLKWRFVNYQWLPYVLCYIIKCWPVQYAVTSSRQRAHSKRNQCLLKSEDTSSTTSLPVSLIKTSSYLDWSWRRLPSSKAFILIKSNDLSQIQFVGEELLDADLVGLN